MPEVTALKEVEPRPDEKALLSSAREEALALLEQARVEAAAILAAAEAQREAVRQQAWQEGYEDGTLAARQAMAAEVEALRSIVANAKLENREFLRGAEQKVLELSLAIAQKVIQKEIAVEPSTVVQPILEAVESIEASSVTRVRVNPENVELLTPYWTSEGGLSDRKIELVPDNRVQSGGCIVETKMGVVDAQIETKLLEIEKAFFSAAGFRYR
jgi:flagellar biosynthesis/type III secretory pathway protein FliH